MKSQFHNPTIVVLFLVFGPLLTLTADQADNSENDDLAGLKKAFNLARASWQSADIDTYFTFIHPSDKYVSYRGNTATIKVKSLEAYVRSRKTSVSEVLRECADCDTKFDLSQDIKERLTKIAASRKRYTVGKLIENAVKQVYGRGIQ